MQKILFLAHTEAGGSLAKPALEALAAACSLAGELTVGLVGPDAGAAADRIAGSGAARFLAVEGEAFAQPRYSTDAAAAEALARAAGAGLILAAHTSRWSRALPGVAARLNGRIDTHVTRIAEVNGAPAVTRWFYRQRMEGVLTRSERPWLVLLESGCCPPWNGPAGRSPSVERLPVQAVELGRRDINRKRHDVIAPQLHNSHQKRRAVIETLQDRLVFLERFLRLLYALAHGEMRRQPRHQFPRGKRLNQIVICPGGQPLQPALFPGPRGEQNHRDGPGLRARAQFAQQPESIQPRHHHIAENQVRRMIARHLQSVFAIADGLYPVSSAQQACYIPAHIGVIVRHKDPLQ